MSYGVVAAGGVTAAVGAAIAQAIKASGAIVRVDPNDFMIMLAKMDSPLIVQSEIKFIKTTYQYLTGYKGFVFYTKSTVPLQLTSTAELIKAKKIWIPG